MNLFLVRLLTSVKKSGPGWALDKVKKGLIKRWPNAPGLAARSALTGAGGPAPFEPFCQARWTVGSVLIDRP